MAVLFALTARRNNAKNTKISFTEGQHFITVEARRKFRLIALRSCVQRMMPAWRDTRAGVGSSQHGTYTA